MLFSKLPLKLNILYCGKVDFAIIVVESLQVANGDALYCLAVHLLSAFLHVGEKKVASTLS